MADPPGTVTLGVPARSLDALFDDRPEPTPPHTDRELRPEVAEHLEMGARLHREAPAIAIEVSVASMVRDLSLIHI